MPIARYYDESRNEDGRAFDGVPLRDLTEEEFDALPFWLQASVDASPLYRKTKPRAEKAESEAPAAPATEPEPVTEPDRKRR
jgi:hypothetical protein